VDRAEEVDPMRALRAVVLLALAGCSSLLPTKLPDKLPPLADVEAPPALMDEPKDEAERLKLPLGGFTGITVADARRSFDELDETAVGVRVARVAENSPGDAAGVAEGDVLLAVTDADGARREIARPSQWRAVEIAAKPGATLHLALDRAGAQVGADVVVAPRVRPAERQEAPRLREEERVGVVVRAATEVEARAAGLGPGGGAVVVGLSAASPWRAAGLAFGDLIVSIDGREVAHPQVVLDAIRAAAKDATLRVEFVRDGERRAVDARVSRRASQIRHIHVPVVFSYDADRGAVEWSALLGLVDYESTIAAWRLRLLWLFKIGGGDADRLVEER
jgi:C-terminal processing protease CtpA/Prc